MNTRKLLLPAFQSARLSSCPQLTLLVLSLPHWLGSLSMTPLNDMLIQ